MSYRMTMMCAASAMLVAYGAAWSDDDDVKASAAKVISPESVAPRSDPPRTLDADDPRDADAKPQGQPTADQPSAAERAADENPLAQIERRMREVQANVAARDSGAKTQRTQQEVVDLLDKLIQSAQQQQSSSSSGAGRSSTGKPSKPSADGQAAKPSANSVGGDAAADGAENKQARNATERVGRSDAKRPDAAQIRSLMREAWGLLPPRLRDDVLQQSPTDRFLPKYEIEIEMYFQRLIEQRDKP